MLERKELGQHHRELQVTCIAIVRFMCAQLNTALPFPEILIPLLIDQYIVYIDLLIDIRMLIDENMLTVSSVRLNHFLWMETTFLVFLGISEKTSNYCNCPFDNKRNTCTLRLKGTLL